MKFEEESIKTSRNIFNKIYHAFQYRETGDNILQWQDDIYLTQKLNVKDIKYWFQGTLAQTLERFHGSYYTYILNTALKLTEDFPYFDIHTPIIYDSYTFRRLKKYDWLHKNYLLKTIYTYEIKEIINEITAPHYEDCSIKQPYSKEEILRRIKGKLFFNTNPQGINPVMIEILEQLYPEKSNFEK